MSYLKYKEQRSGKAASASVANFLVPFDKFNHKIEELVRPEGDSTTDRARTKRTHFSACTNQNREISTYPRGCSNKNSLTPMISIQGFQAHAREKLFGNRNILVVHVSKTVITARITI